MLLSDLLKLLTDDASAAELVLSAGDIQLLSAIRKCAEREGLDLASYSRAAVRRYAADASDEEWLTLLGQLGRAEDPAHAWLKRAFVAAASRGE